MTNRKKMEELSNEEYSRRVAELMSDPFVRYIDYTAFFASEDPEPHHFINKIGTCTIIPSEAELFGNRVSEADTEAYIKTHTKEALVVDTKQFYGQNYYTVIILGDNEKLLSVPEVYIRDFVEC